MKIVRIVTTWETINEIEVPEDWKVPDTYDETLDQVSPQGAWLIDWAEYIPQD